MDYWPDAIMARHTTVNPTRMIQHHELGHLSRGAEADIAVLRVMEGRFGYADGSRGSITGDRRLMCEMTLKGGRVVWDWNRASARTIGRCPATMELVTSTKSFFPRRNDLRPRHAEDYRRPRRP